jgi:hypothetical protein
LDENGKKFLQCSIFGGVAKENEFRRKDFSFVIGGPGFSRQYMLKHKGKFPFTDDLSPNGASVYY